MDGRGKRKCRNCGQLFEPKGTDDWFCSSLCRATGKFVGGGGDTSKPMNYEQRKALEKRGGGIPPKPAETKPKRVRNGDEKFPRVMEMFSLPVDRRWELAKGFTPEEQEHSRRVAKRMLAMERKLDAFITWEGDGETAELGSYDGISGGTLGESDDGTV